MKIYFIGILSFLIFCKAYSQDSKIIDSLKSVISNVEKKCPQPCAEDTNRILAYIGLGEEIFVDKPDSAISLWIEAEKIARNLLANKNTSNVKETTNKCLALAINNIGYVYKYIGEIPKAIENYSKALKIQEENNDLEGVSNTYINIGVIYNNQGDINKALEIFHKSLKIKKQINDKSGMSIVINNIGTIYDDQGDIAKALEYYHKGLNLYEETGNKRGMALALNNIGYIYYNQEDIRNAVDYYNKSLEIRIEIGDKNGVSNSYNNLGSVYKSLVNDSKYINNFELKDSLNNRALDYYNKSLEIRKDIGDNQGVAITLNNIGLIYNNMSDDAKLRHNLQRRDSLLELSIDYCQQSLKIKEESGYKQDLASSLYNLARFYKQQNQILKFKHFAERSYEISKELGFPEDIGNSASLMREIAIMNGNYKKAYEYYQEQMNMKDSLQNEQNYRKTQQQQARYTYQKQAAIDSIAHDKAIQIKDLELAKTEKEKEKQQVVIYSFVFGFAIILIFSILLLRMFFQKKKANQLLAKQNAEISQQKEEIEAQRDEIESQRDQVLGQKEQIEELYDVAIERKNIVEAQQVEIHDSIRYALRIQHAVLPVFSKGDGESPSLWGGLGGVFILFKPKDIVSGDFYWATKTEEWTIVTVADCTGHGVPGAFMSMLGVSFLNEIVRRKEVTDAAMVLNNLRSSVIDALSQTGEEGTQKDGMDMSLIAIHIDSKKALWAGANNPLWLVSSYKFEVSSSKEKERTASTNLKHETSNHKLFELKPDKMPISIYERMDYFTNHEIQLETGDKIYLFSDGFPDQFGGLNGKKFMYKRFKEEILKSSENDMSEQKHYLENTINDWINHIDPFTNKAFEQTDDITVLGIEI